MLYWAAVFFVIAIVAAIVGAGNVEYLATKGAIALFVIALIFMVLGLVGRGRGGTLPPPV
jgi:uncharacterized membrane protein YtjA (UPF0391 family)